MRCRAVLRPCKCSLFFSPPCCAVLCGLWLAGAAYPSSPPYCAVLCSACFALQVQPVLAHPHAVRAVPCRCSVLQLSSCGVGFLSLLLWSASEVEGLALPPPQPPDLALLPHQLPDMVLLQQQPPDLAPAAQLQLQGLPQQATSASPHQQALPHQAIRVSPTTSPHHQLQALPHQATHASRTSSPHNQFQGIPPPGWTQLVLEECCERVWEMGPHALALLLYRCGGCGGQARDQGSRARSGSTGGGQV